MRIFFLSFILTGFFISSYSQGTRISVSGHPQLAWLKSVNEKANGEGLITGLGAILEMDFFFAERYSFYTGISLDHTGGKISFSDTIPFTASGEQKLVPAGTVMKFRLQYLGVPLGLKLKTQEIGYTTIFINMGVTPMVNLRARIYDTGVFPEKSNADDEIRLFNMNYFISSGIEYSLGGSTSLIGGIGYTFGFLDITTRTDDKITTGSLFLKAGILF